MLPFHFDQAVNITHLCPLQNILRCMISAEQKNIKQRRYHILFGLNIHRSVFAK